MEHAAHWRHEHPSHEHEHAQAREPLQGRPEGRTAQSPAPASAWVAFTATLHCLAGCAIGEVLGMVIGRSLAFALVVAGFAAWPVNYWLIVRGRGHAVVYGHHMH